MRAVYTGAMRYGQTGTIRVNECGEFFEFRPDGSARYVPVGRSEFYCPALGDDMDGEKAVRKVQP